MRINKWCQLRPSSFFISSFNFLTIFSNVIFSLVLLDGILMPSLQYQSRVSSAGWDTVASVATDSKL